MLKEGPKSFPKLAVQIKKKKNPFGDFEKTMYHLEPL